MSKKYTKKEAKDYTPFTTVFQIFCIYFLFIPFYKIMYKLKVNGRKNIPKKKPFLVAANHLSLLDPPVITAAILKPIAYMAKKELFEIPVLGPVISALGAFSVNREKLEVSTIKTAKIVLASPAWSMALFPQGGRRRNNKLNKVNKGFITLAKLTKTDILPVGIKLKDQKIAKKPFEGDLTINIGTIIPHTLEMDEIMKEWKKQVCELANLEDNSHEFENDTKNKPQETATQQ